MILRKNDTPKWIATYLQNPCQFNTSSLRLNMRQFILFLGLFISFFAHAEDTVKEGAKKIMVVEFELRDVSPLPNVKQEIERTALIDKVIKKTLVEHDYNIVPACDALKKTYAQGNGYLYDRPEVAGKIGG